MNPFLGAIDHTFKSFGIDWKREALALIVPPLQLDGVTVDIGVVGDVKGKFFFSCPQKTALFLANKLCASMGLAESEEFGEMEHSAFSEISNMMGGTAATNFSLIGKSVNISPPSIIEGFADYCDSVHTSDTKDIVGDRGKSSTPVFSSPISEVFF